MGAHQEETHRPIVEQLSARLLQIQAQAQHGMGQGVDLKPELGAIHDIAAHALRHGDDNWDPTNKPRRARARVWSIRFE